MDHKETLEALNALRSNVVGTQRAGWSNTIYPLVAILNAVGFEQFNPTEEEMRQHLDCYGGAGGYPGHILREPDETWCEPVGLLQSLTKSIKRYFEEPTDKHKENVAYWLGRIDA